MLCFALGCQRDASSGQPNGAKQAELERAQPAPPPLSPQAQHGGQLYAKMCKVCHGEHGEGYKADQAPALANARFLEAVTNDSLYASIADGRRGTTMSAWSTVRSGPLSVEDIHAVVAFLRSWQKGPSAKLDERTLSGMVARAQPIYDRECVRCHGARGIEGPNNRIGDPAWQANTSNGFLRHAIAKGRPGTVMLGFESLGPQAIEDLLVLIRSFALPVPGAPTPEPAQAANNNPPPLPLGPVPLNPKGPEPIGFKAQPATTSADLVAAQLKRGARMALLDARASSDYLNEHIKGAVSVPFYDPSPYIAKLPRDAWLVCYCACPHAESGALAARLVEEGFKKVTVLDEGLGYWKSKGYATSTGEKP